MTSSERFRAWLVMVVLGMVVVAAYAGVSRNEFVNFDDTLYITANPHVLQGLTWSGIRAAFTTATPGNWHPLTMISHMVDVQLFGTNAAAHHLVNVAIHVINAILVLQLLRMMTGSLWRSALVAALFALHPLRVESVAWASERKDVLSTMFGLLTLLAYCGYVRARGRRAGMYGLMCALFALSLLAKPMLVTLPFLMLLLDYWPLRRSESWRRLVIEKSPLLALSAIASVVAVAAQQSQEYVMPASLLPMSMRIANAVLSYVRYIADTFWPLDLSVCYPYPQSVAMWKVAAAGVGLAGVTAFVVWAARRWPHLVVGWLWYLGVLVPVIGLVQLGVQSHADRYTYVPQVGLFIMIAWSLPAVHKNARAAVAAYAAAAIVVIGLLTWLTARQVTVWRDSVRLFRHAQAVNGPQLQTDIFLASVLIDEGQVRDAAHHLLAALRKDPGNPMVHQLLRAVTANRADREALRQVMREFDEESKADATSLYVLSILDQADGRSQDALAKLDEALAQQSDFTLARLVKSDILFQSGRLDEGHAILASILRDEPDNPSALYRMGVQLLEQGRFDSAVDVLARSVQIDPRAADAHLRLAQALLAVGRVAQSIEETQAALRIDPRHAQAHLHLGGVLVRQGEIPRALHHVRSSARFAPDDPVPSLALAQMLIDFGDVRTSDAAEAIAAAQHACELTAHEDPSALATLAQALAWSGRFGEAVAALQRAIDIAQRAGLEDFAAAMESTLDEYRSLADQNSQLR